MTVYNENAHVEYLQFIRDNPGCTGGDISRAFGRNAKTGKRGAQRLVFRGLVTAKRTTNMLDRETIRFYPINTETK